MLQRQFSAGAVSPIQIVVDGSAGSPATQDAIARLKGLLQQDKTFGPAVSETAKSGDLALVSVTVRRAPPGPLAIAKVRELRDDADPEGVRRQRRRRVRDGRHRGQRRLHGHRQPLLPLRHRDRPRAQLRAAARGLPLGRHPGQGDRHEPAQRGRGLRAHHARLREGGGRRTSRLPADRRHRAVGAALSVLGAVRPLHGLPGLPAEPRQGGVRRERRQPPGGHRRGRLHGGHHHGRGADHGRRVRGLRRPATS